jgi:hypothetical protein
VCGNLNRVTPHPDDRHALSSSSQMHAQGFFLFRSARAYAESFHYLTCARQGADQRLGNQDRDPLEAAAALLPHQPNRSISFLLRSGVSPATCPEMVSANTSLAAYPPNKTMARTRLCNRRLRFPANTDSMPEIFGPDRPFAFLTPAPETNALIKSPRTTGLLSKAGKSLPPRECVVADAVGCEPVSNDYPCYQGKLQRILVKNTRG